MVRRIEWDDRIGRRESRQLRQTVTDLVRVWRRSEQRDEQLAGLGHSAARAMWQRVGGGFSNAASDSQATIAEVAAIWRAGVYRRFPAAIDNHAVGNYSFVAGARAHAAEHGMFVWSTRTARFRSRALSRAWPERQHVQRARHRLGRRLVRDRRQQLAGAPTWACYAQNGSGWTCASDRNLKRNLEPLDGTDVLAKLAAMPIYRWQPKDGPNAE